MPKMPKKQRKQEQKKDYPGRASGVDFAAPSMIRETVPGDVTQGTKVTDYAVEVGGTIVPARYFRSFFAEIAAGHTWAEMLDPLIRASYGSGDVDFAVHVQPQSSDRELDEIGRRIAGLRADLEVEENVNKKQAMEQEISELTERQKRIRLNIERSFRVSIQIVASSSEYKSMTQLCRSIIQRFAGKSIYLRAADGRQLEALQAILPSAPAVRLPKEKFMSLESSNVADLFPFSGGSLSHRSGIVIGKDLYGRPVWLDHWHPDLANYHSCVIGRSGAGKSFAVKLIAHRSALIGRQVGIIDWKGEYGDFLAAVGCPYLELHERSQHRINPYDVEVAELPDGTRYVDLEEAANSVQAIVFKMIRVYDASALTGEVKVFVGKAIRDQYQELGITEDPESLYETGGAPEDGHFAVGRRRKRMPELVGLYRRMAEAESEAVRKAAELLRPFTRDGNMPSYAIFDGQTNVELGNAPIFGFAINRLDPEVMRPIGLFVATRWMMERWAKRSPQVQKLLIVEECQNIFNDEDVGGPWAESVYREGRSTNTGVLAVTQGLEVFTRSQAGIAAIKNSPVKVIGIQEPLDIESVQGKLALTEGEADFLVFRARKGEFVVKVDNQSVIVRVDASPFEHLLFTSDPNDPKFAERRQLIRERLQEGGKA